jgi:hypothetical protein
MKSKLILFGSLAALLFLVLRIQGASLITETTPLGIIDFEFANTPERLNKVLFGWSNADIKVNIYLDFVFIPFYVLFFSNAVRACADVWSNRSMSNLGMFLPKAVYLAGGLDLIENKMLLDSFAGSFTDTSLVLTSCIAGAKFLLLLLVILYLVVSIFYLFFTKKNNGIQPLENR